MTSHSITVKVAGESGQGINSIGEILTTALKKKGLYAFGYREYPSLIKGGVASYQIEISERESTFVHQSVTILVAIGRNSVYAYLDSVKKNGIVLHCIKQLSLDEMQQKFVAENHISIHYFDAENIAQSLGDKSVANVIMLALLWNVLGFESPYLQESLTNRYSSKPALLEKDLAALTYVYQHNPVPLKVPFEMNESDKEKETNNTSDDLTITGNEALALGALAAGLRAVYSYPMTPATSIFTYLANTATTTGILVKQAEDEITAIQMAIGSSYAGTRALVVTSGGGFDLMTESVSMAGMTETPIVVVVAQRPGPSTGLPTWTSAADLDVALYAGHGEFPRAILAVSDAATAYSVIQKAFNIADIIQIPVIVLTDKFIAESLYQVDTLQGGAEILRGLSDGPHLSPEDRYQITESGISKRWIPGSSEATYKANSDEHSYDGSSTEDEVVANEMIQKRLRKMQTLSRVTPEPTYSGPTSPKYCFVGWGSNKGVVLAAIRSANAADVIGYVHFETLWPLKTATIKKLLDSNTKLIAIESNATGQLAKLLRQQVEQLTWHNKLLKYNGRPFYIEEVVKFIKELP